ncbi:MAG TPA: glycine cleavage system aminomethyltransferase GcvT [Actinomycetota bacterium]|nr:glycine cleavage system aminomethyltransferase GcvT [Actinomycetota bacterium]
MPDEPLRHSPLEDVHRSLGAKLAPFARWLMPIEYAGALSEHRAVRERVGLFDLSHLGKVDLRGAHAEATIRRLFTNDPAKVAVGRAQYHHLLDERSGGVLEDLFVYRLAAERWFVVPNASNKDLVVGELRSTPAEIEDHDDWCFLGVQGPRSPAVIARLWPVAPDLPFLGCTVAAFGGGDIVLARTGYTGERGYELFAPGDRAAALWDALLETGGDAGIEPCGLGARDVLRLEMGYPLYGQDLDPWHTTLEAGLGWAVSFDKGDFRGRDALIRQREDGLPSLLHGLVTADRRSIPRPHQPVLLGDEVVGEVTSGTFSPTRGTGIALAYLAPGDAHPVGSDVEIDIRGRRAPARVVATPFVDRSPR